MWANVLKEAGINRPALAAHMEQSIYHFNDSMGNGFDPALWVMFETSNGSYYIRPKDEADIEVTNMCGVTKTLSSNEYGVLLSLIYLSNLSIYLCQEGIDCDDLINSVSISFCNLQKYMWDLGSDNLVKLAD